MILHREKRGFTLVELLVVLAIISVLMVTVIITLNPSELLKQSRDTNRLSDLQSMRSAIDLFMADTAGTKSLGTSTITYLSLIDPNATTTAGTDCSGLGFPAGGSFHCPASSTATKSDGTGWLPIDFTKISQGSPLSQLPIDPIDNFSSKEYYSYTTNGTQYTLTANPESNKFQQVSSTFVAGTSATSTNGVITYATSTLSGAGFTLGTFANTTTTPAIPGLMGYSKNLILIPSTTNYVATTYGGTGSIPWGIAFDGTNMWTANYGGNSVTKISPTGTILGTYTGTGSNPIGIAFDGTNMWTANNNSGNSVTKFSPTGTKLGTYYTGSYPFGIAFDGTNMWVTNNAGNSVTKISPTGTILGTYTTGSHPQGIAFDGTNMWIANNVSSSVTKISLTGTILGTYTGIGANPKSIAFDGTNMWTANGDNSVTKISLTGTILGTYTGIGANPQGIAFDGTNMWTVNNNDSSVTKITPSGAVTTYTDTGSSPYAIAFDGTNMWTSSFDDNTVTKLSPTFSSSPGTYTSSPQYLGTVATWGNLSWINQSATGTIIMQARSGSNLSMTNASAWNGTSSCVISASGSALSSGNCVNTGDSYLQYRITLIPPISLTGTPVITSISAGYGK